MRFVSHWITNCLQSTRNIDVYPDVIKVENPAGGRPPNADIYAAMLGLTNSAIDALKADGVN